MYYDTSNIENIVKTVRQAIFVDYGVALQMAVLTNTIYSQPTLEIRWREGDEKFQASKVLGNYPIIGPPNYSWKETARSITNEVRQNIRDARARRAQQWDQQSHVNHELYHLGQMDSRKDLPESNVYAKPATINESFECDDTSKTLLLC